MINDFNRIKLYSSLNNMCSGKAGIKNNQATTRLLTSLKNSSIQYPLLTKDEELQLIDTYRNNRTKLNELLFMHNIKLVFSMSRRYVNISQDFDSIISDGLYGLAVACEKFDIDRGIKFTTYATNWVFKYIVSNFYKKENEIIKNSFSINGTESAMCESGYINNFSENSSSNDEGEQALNYNKIDPIYMYNQKIDTYSDLSALECDNFCSLLVKKVNDDTSISKSDKLIFFHNVYYRECTKEVAEKFNVTQEYVFKIKSKIIKKLKKFMDKKFNIKTMDDIIIPYAP